MIRVSEFRAVNRTPQEQLPPDLDPLIRHALSMKEYGILVKKEMQSVRIGVLTEKGETQIIRVAEIPAKEYDKVRNPLIFGEIIEKNSEFDIDLVVKKAVETFKGISRMEIVRLASTLISGRDAVVVSPPKEIYAALGALPFAKIRKNIVIAHDIDCDINDFQVVVFSRKPARSISPPERFAFFDFNQKVYKNEVVEYADFAKLISTYDMLTLVIASKTIENPQFLEDYLDKQKKMKILAMDIMKYEERIISRSRSTREEFFEHAISTSKGEEKGIFQTIDPTLVNRVYEKYKKLVERHTALKSEYVKIVEDIQFLEKKIKEVNATLKKLDENIELTTQKIEEINSKIEEIKKESEKYEADIRKEKIKQFLCEIEVKALEVKRKRYEEENEMAHYKYIEDLLMEFLEQQKGDDSTSDERIRKLQELSKKKPYDIAMAITKIATIRARPAEILVFNKEELKDAERRAKDAEGKVKSLSKTIEKMRSERFELESELHRKENEKESLTLSRKRAEEELKESEKRLEEYRKRKEEIDEVLSQIEKGGALNVELWLKHDEDAKKLYEEFLKRIEDERVVRELFASGEFMSFYTNITKFKELLQETARIVQWLTSNVGLEYDSVMKNILSTGQETRYPVISDAAAQQAKTLLAIQLNR
ncbi:MAG: hypothetical protein QXL15_01955 [Candidatus Korarchaeota archaeon]